MWQVQRELTEDGVYWNLALGVFRRPKNTFITANTIEECVTLAEREAVDLANRGFWEPDEEQEEILSLLAKS